MPRNSQIDETAGKALHSTKGKRTIPENEAVGNERSDMPSQSTRKRNSQTARQFVPEQSVHGDSQKSRRFSDPLLSEEMTNTTPTGQSGKEITQNTRENTKQRRPSDNSSRRTSRTKDNGMEKTSRGPKILENTRRRSTSNSSSDSSRSPSITYKEQGYTMYDSPRKREEHQEKEKAFDIQERKSKEEEQKRRTSIDNSDHRASLGARGRRTSFNFTDDKKNVGAPKVTLPSDGMGRNANYDLREQETPLEAPTPRKWNERRDRRASFDANALARPADGPSRRTDFETLEERTSLDTREPRILDSRNRGRAVDSLDQSISGMSSGRKAPTEGRPRRPSLEDQKEAPVYTQKLGVTRRSSDVNKRRRSVDDPMLGEPSNTPRRIPSDNNWMEWSTGRGRNADDSQKKAEALHHDTDSWRNSDDINGIRATDLAGRRPSVDAREKASDSRKRGVSDDFQQRDQAADGRRSDVLADGIWNRRMSTDSWNDMNQGEEKRNSSEFERMKPGDSRTSRRSIDEHRQLMRQVSKEDWKSGETRRRSLDERFISTPFSRRRSSVNADNSDVNVRRDSSVLNTVMTQIIEEVPEGVLESSAYGLRILPPTDKIPPLPPEPPNTLRGESFEHRMSGQFIPVATPGRRVTGHPDRRMIAPDQRISVRSLRTSGQGVAPDQRTSVSGLPTLGEEVAPDQRIPMRSLRTSGQGVAPDQRISVSGLPTLGKGVAPDQRIPMRDLSTSEPGVAPDQRISVRGPSTSGPGVAPDKRISVRRLSTSGQGVSPSVGVPSTMDFRASVDQPKPQPPDGTSVIRRGLRFSPAVLVFRDVFEGERRALRFNLQNVSSRPVRVIVVQENSVFFSLEDPGFDAVLAPGMKHENVITLQQYSWHSESILNSMITVVVDDVPHEYRVETHFAIPKLEVKPGALNFGEVNLGAPVLVGFVSVRNASRLGTSFAVDTGGESGELTVRPMRGKLKAHEEILLRCEFAPAVEGDFSRDLWVRGSGMACCIPIMVLVVCPKLTIRYPISGGDGAFALLNFGSVYYGAQHRLVATVNNTSADICTFVVLAEMPGNKLMTFQKAQERDPRLKAFQAHPLEGRISCFETRIFSFGFNPQLGLDELDRANREVRDFQLFVRILRVACIDYGISQGDEDDDNSLQKMSDENLFEGAADEYTRIQAAQQHQRELQKSTVRVCLHGRAMTLALSVTPRSLHAGRLPLGESENRVLRLNNDCAAMPLWFRVATPPPPGVRVTPHEGMLRPNSAIELAVCIQPVSYGTSRSRLRLELLSPSRPLLAPAERVVLGVRNVRVCYECPAVTRVPRPKISPGLSPNCIREVGAIGDGVPFCTDVPIPYMAMPFSPRQKICRQNMWKALPFVKDLRSFGKDLPRRKSRKEKVYEAWGEEEEEEEDSVCGDFKCTECKNPLACVPLQKAEKDNKEKIQDSPVSSDSSTSSDKVPALEVVRGVMEQLLVPEIPPLTSGVIIGRVSEDLDTDVDTPTAVVSATITSAAEASTASATATDGTTADASTAEAFPIDVSATNTSVADVTTVSVAIAEVSVSGFSTSDLPSKSEGGDPAKTTSELIRGAMEVITKSERHKDTYSTAGPVSGVALPSVASHITPKGSTPSTIPSGCKENVCTPEVCTLFVKKPRMTARQAYLSSDSSKFSAYPCDLPWGFRTGKAYGTPTATRQVKIVSGTTESRVKSLIRAPSSLPSKEEPSLRAPPTSPEHPTTRAELVSSEPAKLPSRCPSPLLSLESDYSEESVAKVVPRRKQNKANSPPTEPVMLYVAPVTAPPTACFLTYNRRYPYDDTLKLSDPYSGFPCEKMKRSMDVPQPSGRKNKSKGSKRPSRIPRLKTGLSVKAKSQRTSNCSTSRSTSRFTSRITSRNTSRSTKRTTHQSSRPSKRCSAILTIQPHSDSSSGSWDEKDSFPVSPPPATPMTLNDEAIRNARILARGLPAPAWVEELPLEELGGTHAKRCETLRWARGEQLHPHCAFIAFPNDVAQRSVRPWPPNRLTRTIFLGVPRYSAPLDPDLQSSPAEIMMKTELANASRRHIREFGNFQRSKALAKMPQNTLAEYEVGNAKLYNLDSFQPDPVPEQIPCGIELPHHLTHKHALIPLMPSQLINVRLKPSAIDFGTVGVGSRVNFNVLAMNYNTVLVKLNISTVCPNITVPGNGVVYIQPKGRNEFKITLETSTLGRYNGVLRYVLNDSHTFEAAVTADVVVRTLNLPIRELFFGFIHGFEEAWPKVVHVIPIQNTLQDACRYEWSAFDKTCFDIIPRKGIVPSKSVSACEVHYRVNHEAQTPNAELVLTTDNNRYQQISCHLLPQPSNVPPARALNAGFVRPKMTLPDLAVMGCRRFVLQLYNASYLETIFRVMEVDDVNDETKLDLGDRSSVVESRVSWRVRPASGTLRPRSVRHLHLTLHAHTPGVMQLSIRVALGMDAFAPPTAQATGRSPPHGQEQPHPRKTSEDPEQLPQQPSEDKESSRMLRRPQTIAVQTLTADVVLPLVEVSPKRVHLQRVPAGSQVCRQITLTNTGTVEAAVQVPAVALATMGTDWVLSMDPEDVVPLPTPLLLLPKSDPVHIYLLFRPLDVASYEFVLPLLSYEDNTIAMRNTPLSSRHHTSLERHSSLGRHSSVSKANWRKSVEALSLPSVTIEATVSRRILSLSQMEFAFNYNTMEDSSNLTEHTLTVENVNKERVFFWMPLEPSVTSPFYVVPMDVASKASPPPSSSRGKMRVAKKTPVKILQAKLAALDSIWQAMPKVHQVEETPTALNTSSIAIWDYVASNPLPDEDDNSDDVVLTCMLQPKDVCSFSIIYDPRESGSFSSELPVYVGGIGTDDFPMTKLHLKAVSSGPILSIPVQEVHLPPRPINQPSEANLTLSVSGHDSDVSISWKCIDVLVEWGRAFKDCLQVVMIKKWACRSPLPTHLTFTVVFKSPRPVGLRARIVFSSGIASDSASCSLLVTAMADASIFTTHSFFRSRQRESDEQLPPPPNRRRAYGKGLTRRALKIRSIVRRSTLYSDEEDGGSESEGIGVGCVHSSERCELLNSLAKLEEEQKSASGFRRASTYSLLSMTSMHSLTSFPVPAVQDQKNSFGFDPSIDYSLGSEVSSLASAINLLKYSGMESIRRHRGISRCGSETAEVDADLDSLLTSESSASADDTEGLIKGVVISPEENISFPAFPEGTDISEYAEYMRRVQQAVEEWLFDVILQRQYWITIPGGFNQLYRAGSHKAEKKTITEGETHNVRVGKPKPKKRHGCPFDITTSSIAIMNIIGSAALDFFKKNMPNIPTNDENWTYDAPEMIIPGNTFEGVKETVSGSVSDPRLHSLAQVSLRRYTLMIHMMRCSGAVMPHVRPEYLLDYNQYKEIREFTEQAEASDEQHSKRESISLFLSKWKSGSQMNYASDEEIVKQMDPGFDKFTAAPLLTPQRHYQLSRQAWLDVCLQWARVFWLPKIDEEHTRAQQAVRYPGRSASTEDTSLKFRSRQYNVASAAFYSEQELCLLAWLNERYAHARNSVCGPHGPYTRDKKHKHRPLYKHEIVYGRPHRRNISNFDTHLRDGVVLAYVTLDACPYTLDYLKDIYPSPNTLEKAEHNAARVLAVWQTLHLCFTVSVRDLVRPVAVKMLLLVAYLYNVLPALSARATLSLSAPLATESTIPLTLANPSDHHLRYLVEFIGDEHSFFSVLGAEFPVPEMGINTSAASITLPPRQNFNLEIKFHAHSLMKQHCTLLLSGSLRSPNFGRSLAIRLEGKPSALAVSGTLRIRSPLYVPTKRTLELPMPYVPASFDFMDGDTPVPEFRLYLENIKPSVDHPFAGCAWVQLRGKKMIHRLFLNQNTVTAIPPRTQRETKLRQRFIKYNMIRRPPTPQPYGNLSVTVCALTPQIRHFWIGCVSPDLGDFIIKVVTKPTKGKPLAPLMFTFPPGWMDAECVCDGNFFGENAFKLCPLVTVVQIPSCNTQLRKAVSTMFKKTLDEFDLEFWKAQLHSDIGVKLMSLDLEQNAKSCDEYSHFFNTNVDYRVSLDAGELMTPTELNIPDTLSDDLVPLPLHVTKSTASDAVWDLTLLSADQREVRRYRLRGVATEQDLRREQEIKELKEQQELEERKLRRKYRSAMGTPKSSQFTSTTPGTSRRGAPSLPVHPYRSSAKRASFERKQKSRKRSLSRSQPIAAQSAGSVNDNG